MNFVVRSLKFSSELVGSLVNQPSGPSWREVGNILHHSALVVVYKVICVLKKFRCLSRSVEPSYGLMVNPFHIGGSGVSIILFVNGCPLRSSSSSGQDCFEKFGEFKEYGESSELIGSAPGI